MKLLQHLRIHIHVVCLGLIAIPLVSCTSHLSPPSPAPVYAMGSTSNNSSKLKPQTRVLIKTGSMSLQVNDVKATSASAKKLVKQHHGYLESISSNDDKDAYANLEVRVPKTGLQPLMDDLAGLGKVSSRNITVEDVTEQWIDLQAKINNLRALRDRLRKLLIQAKNVKETLEVEKELTRVQSELDALEGKIKAMQKHVAYSKLTIRIRQKSIAGPIGAVGKGAWWGIKKLFVIK